MLLGLTGVRIAEPTDDGNDIYGPNVAILREVMPMVSDWLTMLSFIVLVFVKCFNSSCYATHITPAI